MKITITLTNSETGETLTVQEATVIGAEVSIEELQAMIVEALHESHDFTVETKP